MIEDNYNDDIELLDEPEVMDAGDGTLYAVSYTHLTLPTILLV